MIHWTLFCLGNKYIHLLKNQRRYKLRIEMKDWRGRERYSECDNFVVGPESSKFKLISVGVCTGNARKCIFIHSFVRSFVHSFIHSFIHSVSQSVSHFRHK